MKVFLVIVLIVVIGLFIWQLALFIRDLIKKIKSRKIKKAVDKKSDDSNKSADEDSARKE